jgi:hypothetical protein
LGVAKKKNMFAPTNIRQQLDSVRQKGNRRKTELPKNSFDIDIIDINRVYHIHQIKKICIDYRLRFLDATLFKGTFPVEAVDQIKAIEKAHDTELTDLKMMAPSKLFKLENADDPLLFAPMGNGYYYLIHQWGNDLHPLRKALVWPFKNLITMCITTLVLSFVLSLFVPLAVFTPNPTSSDFFLVYFFMFKSVAAIVIYYTFARGKNVSQAIWNSKYYNS